MFSPRGLLASARAIDRGRVDRLVAAVLLVEIELQVWLDRAIHARVFAAVAGVLLALAVRLGYKGGPERRYMRLYPVLTTAIRRYPMAKKILMPVDELRKVLSVRQEATAVMMGLLK